MRQRRLLTVMFLGCLALAACGDDGGVQTGDAGGLGDATTVPATSVAATSTSAAASTEVTTTAAPTTAPTTAPATTATPTTAPATTATPTTVPGLSALGTDTNLQPDGSISLSVAPGGDVCSAFSPPGWVTQTCDMFVVLGDFWAVVQREAGDGHFRVVVLVPGSTPGTYVSEYVAEEPGAGVWSAVTVVHGSFHFGSGPFNGDAEGLWVGYRYDGTGQYLDLDVIEWFEDGTARRGALKGLDHGRVRVRPGGADVATNEYGPSDPNCCPSGVRMRQISWSANRWRIDTGTVYPVDDPATAITSDF